VHFQLLEFHFISIGSLRKFFKVAILYSIPDTKIQDTCRAILKLGSQGLGQGSTFFVREILDGIYPFKYFMLLRGVPPTQKHVVMIIFKSKYM